MTRTYIITEGMRPGSSLSELHATLLRVERAEASNAESDQPKVWTIVTFDSALEPDRLAAKLSEVLDSNPRSWYSHFQAGTETYVVLPGRVFHYPVGDRARKAEAQEYARSVGVPSTQVDWDDG